MFNQIDRPSARLYLLNFCFTLMRGAGGGGERYRVHIKFRFYEKKQTWKEEIQSLVTTKQIPPKKTEKENKRDMRELRLFL